MKLTKKILVVLVIILLPAIWESMHASDNYDHYPPDIKRIKERGKLVVAMFAQDIPPFFMHDDLGNFYGLDVKLAKDIAGRIGVDVEFNREARTFNEIIDIVARNEADVAISWLSRTLERAEKVRYTRPYIVLCQGLLINRLKLAELPRQANSLKTLNHPDAVVGVRSGTSYVDYARNLFPRAEIREYPDWEPYIVNAVFEGELVAGYHDEIEIRKYVMSRPETSIRTSTAIIKDLTDPIAMAVPWDSHALLDWLNVYIEMHVNGWDAGKLLHEYEESLLHPEKN